MVHLPAAAAPWLCAALLAAFAICLSNKPINAKIDNLRAPSCANSVLYNSECDLDVSTLPSDLTARTLCLSNNVIPSTSQLPPFTGTTSLDLSGVRMSASQLSSLLKSLGPAMKKLNISGTAEEVDADAFTGVFEGIELTELIASNNKAWSSASVASLVGSVAESASIKTLNLSGMDAYKWDLKVLESVFTLNVER